ncbi:MAG: short chain dehydrogenase, partial [Sediminibacterium sp.]
AALPTDPTSINTLLPLTTLDTPAFKTLLGVKALANMSRTPAILADAAYAIVTKKPLVYTGQTFIDEGVLAAEGVTDLSHYSVVPGGHLYTDLFL